MTPEQARTSPFILIGEQQAEIERLRAELARVEDERDQAMRYILKQVDAQLASLKR